MRRTAMWPNRIRSCVFFFGAMGFLFAFHPSPPALSQTPSAPEIGERHSEGAPTIRLAYPRMDCEFCFEFARRLYEKAFDRLGFRAEIVTLPGERALIASNSGQLDGEAGRLDGFDPEGRFPNLIRVPESLRSVDLVAYAVDPNLTLAGWPDLARGTFSVVYIRGTRIIRNRLAARIAPYRRIEVNDSVQACRILLSGRARVLVALRPKPDTLLDTLLKTYEFRASGIHRVGDLETLEVHPYLHRRHVALVPELARVLREMKADGSLAEIETISRECVERRVSPGNGSK